MVTVTFGTVDLLTGRGLRPRSSGAQKMDRRWRVQAASFALGWRTKNFSLVSARRTCQDLGGGPGGGRGTRAGRSLADKGEPGIEGGRPMLARYISHKALVIWESGVSSCESKGGSLLANTSVARARSHGVEIQGPITRLRKTCGIKGGAL